MNTVWRFIRKPANLAVLIAIGGAMGFIWTQVLHPDPAQTKTTSAAGQISQNVSIGNAAIGVAATGNAQVTIGHAPSAARASNATP
jgi:hypothetical protein